MNLLSFSNYFPSDSVVKYDFLFFDIIPGAGHDLVFSQKELVIGKVLDFL